MSAILLDPQRRLLRTDAGSAGLTGKEAAIMTALCRRNGRVASRDDIMTEVYNGNEPDGGSKVLDVYLSRLRRKLLSIGARESIATEWGEGWACSDVEIAGAAPLLLTARQRADLRELLETHPNKALADRVAIAIGEG